MRLSGHLDTSRNSVIGNPGYLGCKGSWVQIPPRRPTKSSTYASSACHSNYLILPKFPQESFSALGTNSGQRYSPNSLNFDLSFDAESAVEHLKFSVNLRAFKGRGAQSMEEEKGNVEALH